MPDICILLAVDHKENRRLLQQYLEQYYNTVLVVEQATDLQQKFDVGIFDGVALNRLWSDILKRREAEQPRFLPNLLVTTRHDIQMVTRSLGRTIDEIIFTPIEKIELMARVEVLVRARRSSVELAARNTELQREIDAHRLTEKALEASDARTRLLQLLTSELAAANTPDDVAGLLTGRIVPALDAKAATIAVLSQDGSSLDLLAEKTGVEDKFFPLHRLPLDYTYPITVSARTAKSFWFATQAECLTQFPRLQPVLNRENIHAVAVMPLIVSDQSIGALSIYFTQAREFDENDRAFFQALAQQCAQAVERTRLYQQAEQKGILQERKRLARELHDDVSQSLYMINLTGQTLPMVWEKNPERGRELLNTVVRLTRSAVSEMRLLLLEMRPGTLMQTGLHDLFQHLINKAQSRKNVEITCDVGINQILPEEIHLGLYRIVQECVNNIVKHSGATEATISLNVEDGRLMLRVRDNGRGFNTQTQKTGMGLNIMGERAALLNASYEISSREDGAGTEVQVSLPLPDSLAASNGS